MELQTVSKDLLRAVAGIDGEVKGAFNLRQNGDSVERFSTSNVTIRARADGKPGIDVLVKPGTKGESVHIPVILTESGLVEQVYNDFIIGDDCEVTIIAGCGIHNDGHAKSQHDGVHTFTVGKNSRVVYSEKHYGEGSGSGERVLNPVTKMQLGENAFCEMELTQIEGVSSTVRDTNAHLGTGARLVMVEKLLTHNAQTAVSNVDIQLDGDESSAQIISRSVAKESSSQTFNIVAQGNAACRAHIQCDAILMDAAQVRSMPAIAACHPEAEIIHEAAIGRINSEQLVKLETLGLAAEEAEQVIIDAFLE